MGKKKKRGKEGIVKCSACGARIPRTKSVLYEAPVTYSAENPDDPEDVVKTSIFRKNYYCVSCGKHRGIFEKKKRQQERRKQRRE